MSGVKNKNRKPTMKELEKKIKEFLSPHKEPLRVVDYYVDENGEPKSKEEIGFK